MQHSLPQHSSRPRRRTRTLARIAAGYGYDHEALYPFALSDRVPRSMLRVAPRWFRRWLTGALPVTAATVAGVARYARDRVGGRSVDLPGFFADLHRGFFETPPYLEELATNPDVAFGRQRLCGQNPFNLRALADERDLPPGFHVDLSTLGVQDDLSAGRLFLQDYHEIAEALGPRLPGGPERQDWLPAPFVLLRLDESHTLQPVAIQVDRDTERDAPPVWTPRDGEHWRLAMLYAQVADAQHAQFVVHYARHHLGLQPFAIATARRLSHDHPLYALLWPHLHLSPGFERAAWRLILGPGGAAHDIFAGSQEVHHRLMANAGKRLRFRDLALATDLRARGLDRGPFTRADFPYRDDGALLGSAIERYAHAAIAAIYQDDAAITADWELQGWIAELRSPEGGHVRGLLADEDAGLNTRAELADIVALLIFLVSPAHAAAHYPQREYFGFVPNTPGLLRAPPPRRGETIPDRDAGLAERFPSLGQGLNQFWAYCAGSFRYDRLGDFREHALGRIPALQPAIRAFRAELAQIEDTITGRNRGRAVPYPYLLPSRLPNGTHI